ncbi:MAG: hypothetical protein D6690_10170 [Nitrospirae bacterium]|nr:MAG: hypothetical protein D6690_10170 [Nitrospirota bacterium]
MPPSIAFTTATDTISSWPSSGKKKALDPPLGRGLHRPAQYKNKICSVDDAEDTVVSSRTRVLPIASPAVKTQSKYWVEHRWVFLIRFPIQFPAVGYITYAETPQMLDIAEMTDCRKHDTVNHRAHRGQSSFRTVLVPSLFISGEEPPYAECVN